MYTASQYAKERGNYTPESFSGTAMKTAFSSTANYDTKVRIVNGEVYLTASATDKEKEWAQELGIESFTLLENGVDGINITSNAFGGAYTGTDKNIEIPAGMTSISNSVFMNNTSIETVLLPDTVTEIGNATFDECSNLSTISLPQGLTSIGNEAFNGCALKSITIPSSVTSIGFDAFGDCDNLKSVIIEAGSSLDVNDALNWEINTSVTTVTKL